MAPAVAFLDAILIVLAGFGFVCLVIGLFLLITRVVAPRLLDEDDGSSQ
jgi:hypothetical protein